MAEVSEAEAKAHLSEILRRVELGEIVTITRRGRPVVRVVSVPAPGRSGTPKEPIDFEALRVFRESIPMSNRSAAEMIREMRDGSK